MTEDVHETGSVAAIFGLTSPFYRLDLSVGFFYKGENTIEKVAEFGTYEFTAACEKEDDVKSYVANVILEPCEDMLTLSAFSGSESGDGDPNYSIGGALTVISGS